MMNSILETVANTPWWVYLIFVYAARVSFAATKPRVVPIRTLLVLPGIFITLSAVCLSLIMTINAFNIFLWASALVVGIPLGWMQFHLQKIKAIKDEAKLYFPGTWSLFWIFMIIFSTKYYYSYTLFFDPMTIASSRYAPYILLIYGLCTGLFLGKLIYSMNCYRFGPYTTLQEAL